MNNDGGPAFPRGGGLRIVPHDIGSGVDRKNIEPSNGMSLRDYFAGQALPTLIQLINKKTLPWQDVFDTAVEMSYLAADTMLAEREKNDG